MPEGLAIILALSAITALLAYWRAHRLHRRVERLCPGLNALMRRRRKHTGDRR